MLTPASELRKDRLADRVIRIGGVTVIVLVIAMVVVIAAQALPLFRPTTIGPAETLSTQPVRAVGAGGRSQSAWWIGADGALHGIVAGDPVVVGHLTGGVKPVAIDIRVDGLIAILEPDGSGFVGRVRSHRGDAETGLPAGLRWQPMTKPSDVPSGDRLRGITAAGDDDRLLVARWSATAAEVAEYRDGREVGRPRLIDGTDIVAADLAPSLDHLALIGADGSLRLDDLTRKAAAEIADLEEPVVAARFLPGGRSLVVVTDAGAVLVLQLIPRVEITNSSESAIEVAGVLVGPHRKQIAPAAREAIALGRRVDVRVLRATPVWRPVHRLDAISAPVTAIAVGRSGRSFAVADAAGEISIYNATSGRLLRRDRWSLGPVTALALSPRTDALVAATEDGVVRRDLVCRHPDVSLRTLFLPVWYEGLAEPRAVWQTSGGSDGFQPKYSLWPLLLGTIKATVYAMLVSVPLALLAALYVSQLAPSWLQSLVKPAVEMMAAVPTVVVGFLAALWLAPRLQLWLFPTLVGVAALPVAVVAALWIWRLLPQQTRRRLPEGGELVALLAGCALVVGLAVVVAGPLERRLFDGDFQAALYVDWGIQVEQRNGLIVGLALGFAVIPVIFTIAEDACSGVPPALIQSARALGATRWQAAVRLVAPAASPGLLAAVMLGLGRAVGETMIVLMAAGNTPILDLGPFNGMRTMSAAMAFEMPEATVGGTLFRVLFFTGFLLFGLSLFFTTAADLIGSQLRKRHAQL